MVNELMKEIRAIIKNSIKLEESKVEDYVKNMTN